LGGSEYAWLIARIATGLFFTISGFFKLFNPGRHKVLTDTLKDDRIPWTNGFQWIVPTEELVCGMCITLGLFTVPAALILIALLLVAMGVDGYKRVNAFEPIDIADWLDDWLYLSEITYILLLLLFVTGGPGILSVDSVIIPWLEGR
jgi:uncharacterized membrane protein YphA (DoxX/SURF4 family)